LIIAQITDIHIGFGGPDSPCKNTDRLKAVLSQLMEPGQKPDVLIITGDLVEDPELWAYQRLRAILDEVEVPYYLALGNHDSRTTFQSVFPEYDMAQGFLQYTIEDWPMRIIVLDTLKVGFHGGDFCEKRIKWLSQKLAEFPDKPTLIALHHPPIETGIGWMTSSARTPWIIRLESILEKHQNVVQLICGHIHRRITKPFANSYVSVSGAVAPQVKLDLSPIDPDVPDDRVLLVDGPGEYMLYKWESGTLTAYSAIAPEGPPIVRFDESHAAVVRTTLDLNVKTN